MNIVRCTQGDGTWFAARAGKVTASDIADALTLNTTGPRKGIGSAARDKIMAILLGEMWSGEPNMEGYISSYMRRGTELEPDARIAYEQLADVMVETVGFVIHPTIAQSGASPDGLVGDDGGVELKCPAIQTHVSYLLNPELLKDDYADQVNWNIACTDRAWWDLMSYCPGFPCVRTTFLRNPVRIAEMEDGVRGFLAEAEGKLQFLREKYPVADPGSPAQVSEEELNKFFDRMGFADVP